MILKHTNFSFFFQFAYVT